jgi:voltage-gated potassium channel
MAADRPTIVFPRRPVEPLRSLTRRVFIALGVILLIALLTYFGRGGYRDATGTPITLLDAIYYSTVTVTTTGYGDIYPASPAARAVTAFIVTPARVIFLIVLVGTTLAVLSERFREAVTESNWRRRVRNHTVVAGYGTKGRGAVQSLIANGTALNRIVAIDTDERALGEARDAGVATIRGDATRTAVLSEAMVEQAAAVIVTCGSDDTATLVTLTARERNPNVTIVAAAKEAENAHLLRQSGATTVIVSSEAAGRLLGLATAEPRAVAVLEDLIGAGVGLHLAERPALPDEVGGPPRPLAGELPVAIVRGAERIAFDDARFGTLSAGDVVVVLSSE